MVWKAHECPYLIETPFLFITTKSWDCVSKRLLAEPGVGLSKVKEGFWKKVDEIHAGHQILEEMAGLFPDG